LASSIRQDIRREVVVFTLWEQLTTVVTQSLAVTPSFVAGPAQLVEALAITTPSLHQFVASCLVYLLRQLFTLVMEIARQSVPNYRL
jgi:hypothetical protein